MSRMQRFAVITLTIVSAALSCAQSPVSNSAPPAAVSRSTANAAVGTPTRPAGASPSPSSGAENAALPMDPDHVQSQADCPKGMVFIPAGRFTYKGPAFDDGSPVKEVNRTFDIASFCIDFREVSTHDVMMRPQTDVKSYSRYCDQKGDAQTCFTQEQAENFCVESNPNNPRRLPRPEEWLYAALGTDGRRFPWGNTWYPWGDDRSKGRPDYFTSRKEFCDFAYQWDQADKETRLTLSDHECYTNALTFDVGPFNVSNMGSNVLEWAYPTCTVMGINHLYYPPEDVSPPGDVVLVDKKTPVSCDPNKKLAERTSQLIGFRCVTTERFKEKSEAAK